MAYFHDGRCQPSNRFQSETRSMGWTDLHEALTPTSYIRHLTLSGSLSYLIWFLYSSIHSFLELPIRFHRRFLSSSSDSSVFNRNLLNVLVCDYMCNSWAKVCLACILDYYIMTWHEQIRRRISDDREKTPSRYNMYSIMIDFSLSSAQGNSLLWRMALFFVLTL
jgi:hypothetical protein